MNAQHSPQNPLFTTLRFALFTLCCAMLVAFATAQTPANPSMPGTVSPNSPQTASPGWMWFDDKTSSAMNLDQATMDKLRAVDETYRQRYTALGTTPWSADGYNSLTGKREAEIKGILTAQQYDQWITNYGSQRPMGTIAPTDKSGTTTPR